MAKYNRCVAAIARLGLAALALLALDARTLAGEPPYRGPVTTIITHGFSPDSKGPWVQGMAEAIVARAGAGSIYRYTGPTGHLSLVPSAFSDGSHEVIVVIFNWVPESDGPSTGPNLFYTQSAGDVLASILRDAPYDAALPAPGPSDLASDRIVHFIGHSRGACVNSDAARRLGVDGVAVDQLTTHDPHPVNGTLDSPYNFNWGDAVPQRWSNVTWADNYWRADGGGLINGLDFDGIPLSATFNTQLSESALNCCAYTFAHSDVHLWYHGTVDLASNACDGEQCITAQMNSTWWPEGRSERGYFYSMIGGGSALRVALPDGAELGSLPRVFGGDFDQGSYAGWIHHGGFFTGAAVLNESGDWHARIGPAGNAAVGHNVFYLPNDANAIVFAARVAVAGGGESLQIALHDKNDNAYAIGQIGLDAAGGWMMHELAIPSAVPRGSLFRLTFSKSGGIVAVVDVDEIDVTSAPAVPGDVDANGCVDVDDLLAVINAWGVCGSCPADINGNGSVDVDDLLMVINNWQPCG